MPEGKLMISPVDAEDGLRQPATASSTTNLTGTINLVLMKGLRLFRWAILNLGWTMQNAIQLRAEGV